MRIVDVHEKMVKLCVVRWLLPIGVCLVHDYFVASFLFSVGAWGDLGSGIVCVGYHASASLSGSELRDKGSRVNMLDPSSSELCESLPCAVTRCGKA